MNLLDLFVRIGADTSEAESGISGLSGKLKTGLATAAKVGGAAVTAAAAGVTALTKSAIDEYAEYEQLVGGVETLFKNSAGVVQGYADAAYKSAGMSANAYMETVTSFSASLLQSLDGDTAAAAEAANQAVIDMADNANKMGSSIESIQNAYQGFAKQNYTMLDNLKLGYGGTASEMARLVNDSGVLGDAMLDLSDTQTIGAQLAEVGYAKIVEAIHAVQTEMGITGTTAKEASTTIQGSISSMQSAWGNLMTGLADPSQDLGVLIDNLVESVVTVGENIIPRIGETIPRILDGITSLASVIPPHLEQLLSDVFPILVNSVTTLTTDLVKVIPSVLNTAMKQLPDLAKSAATIIIQLTRGISDNSGELMNTLAEVVTGIIEVLTGPDVLSNLLTAVLDLVTNLAVGIIEMIPTLISVVPIIITNVITAVVENIPVIVAMIPTIINAVIDAVVTSIPLIVNAGITLLTSLVGALPDIISGIVAVIPELISAIVNAILGLTSELIQAGIDLFTAIIEDLPAIITNLVSAIPEIIASITGALAESFPELMQMGVELFSSLIADLPTIIMNVVEALPEIITASIETFMNNISLMIDIGVNLFTAIIEGIPKAIVMIVGAIPEIISAIKDAFLSVDWGDIGKQLMNGIGEGFKNGVESVKEKFKEGGEKLRETLRDFFGIHSPSRMFAEMGEFLALGLGEGWDDTIPGVAKSINEGLDFSTSEVKPAKSGGLGGSGFGGIVININGVQYQDFNELAAAISERIQFITDREVAGYGA